MRALFVLVVGLTLTGVTRAQVLDGKSADDPARSRQADVASKSAGTQTCVDGFAGSYTCFNVDLLGHMPRSALGAGTFRLNDIWGWEDIQTGRRYAIVGREDGTSFVDVTDPAAPVYLGNLPRTSIARSNVWRDIKMVGDHAFIVADGAGPHGMQVFDMKVLRGLTGASPVEFTAVTRYEGFGSAHNIVTNPETGFAYAVGSSSGVCDLGLHMIDVSVPERPQFAGCFRDNRTRRGYSHDAQCVTYRGPDLQFTGREICIGSNEDAISIVDVTDKSLPIPLGVGSYPAAGYVHQGWLTDDHRYFYQDDELDERSGAPTTRTLIWDLADLDDPQLASIHEADTPSIDHNLYVRDSLMYQANYTAGLRVLDIRDPESPVEVGWFDTTPGNDEVSFEGAWSVYPFFSDGTLAVSSRREGLFLLKVDQTVITRVADFRAQTLQSGAVRFLWTLESQLNIRSLELERQTHDGGYQVVASFDGSGTTVVPVEFDAQVTAIPEGRSMVRLVAVSPTGGRAVLLEEEVFVVPGTHVITDAYPNPASANARLALVVAEPQQIAVRVFNTAGQEVALVHQGWISPEEELSWTLNVARWPSGRYWVEYRGNRFQDVRPLVVTR